MSTGIYLECVLDKGEAAYRRCFHQGAIIAVAAATKREQSVKLDPLLEKAATSVRDWRYQNRINDRRVQPQAPQ